MFLSLVLLIPGQSDVAVGIELLAISAVVVPAFGVLAKPGTRAPEQPRVSWLGTNVVPSAIVALAPAVAAIGLFTESLGGLYWLPVAVALALAAGLVNAWVLLVEILR